MVEEDTSANWQPKSKRAKTPTILQMEAVECGAAALAILMGHYKYFEPLEKLRVDCGVSRDGSKASRVVIAARKHGFKAEGFRYNLEKLDEVKVPFIVFWNFNHFLVVEGFSKGIVYLNDPGTGPRQVTLDEFDQGFTGVVLLIEPDEGFKPKGKPPSVMSALLVRLRHNFDAVFYLLLIGLLLVIPGLLIPVFTKVFIDNYLGDNLESWLRPLLIGMGLTALGRGLLTWMQRYYLTRFETKLDLRDSSRFFWHILHLPIVFFSQRSAGDLSSRIMLNSRVAKVIASDVARSVLNVFVIVFYLALMIMYSWVLAMVSVIIATINFIILQKITRVRKDKNIQLSLSQAQFSGAALNGIRSMETLKACGRENDFFAKLVGIQAKIVNANQELSQKTTFIGLMPSLLNGINTAAILALGGYFVIKGQMTVGMLVAFQSLSISFISPINDIVGVVGIIQQLSGDMNKIDDVIKHEVVTDPPSDPEAPLKKLMGHIELKNLSFGYNVTMPPLLKNFSLSLKPGQRVALVGSSGSGKSTVAKLLARLYDLWGGGITIDDKPIESIPFAEYYSSVSLVDQDIRLFSGTIRENITMWDSTILEEEVIRAAKDACIHDDIMSRPEGYDSVIAEGGGNFSGGQRQRIEIARALSTNPRVLIMDEATSALDPLVEKEIDENIRRRGCSCIIIAHRLSTIRDSDEIIVLKQGEIVERGTHDKLVTAKGAYANLVSMAESS